MKKTKRIAKVKMAVFAVLMAGILAGCSKQTASGGGTRKHVDVNFDDKVTYSYWLYATPSDYTSNYNDNPIVEYYEKKYNVDFQFLQPAAGTEIDSLNLMLGTGEYTDLIDTTYFTGSLSQLYNDGIIINIVDYLEYMPNLKALMDSNEIMRKHAYNDDGQILRLPNYLTDTEGMWGGLVYRRDIIDLMTGGYVSFPSGNSEPTTIEDIEYMLPLFKAYFEAAGMSNSAPLIIPAAGYFNSGDFLSTFGGFTTYFHDGKTVKYGPYEDSYRTYLEKMHEWYKNGWIYSDFASRTNDLFYLPNTELTYGGAAGIWFGLTSQLGDAMSMPQYGLIMNVQPLANPITKDNAHPASNFLFTAKEEQSGGVMITKQCKNIERLLTIIDKMYSTEGAYLKGYGMDIEHGAAENAMYKKYGLTDGTYSLAEDGSLVLNNKLSAVGGDVKLGDFTEMRMPGLRMVSKQFLKPVEVEADKTWLKYGCENKLPVSLYMTEEEEKIYSDIQTRVEDYMNEMTLKFILGKEEINDASWVKYKDKLKSFGMEDNLKIYQAMYDRYLKR